MRYIQIDANNHVIGEVTVSPYADQSVYEWLENDPNIVKFEGDLMMTSETIYNPETKQFEIPKVEYFSKQEILDLVKMGINQV